MSILYSILRALSEEIQKLFSNETIVNIVLSPFPAWQSFNDNYIANRRGVRGRCWGKRGKKAEQVFKIMQQCKLLVMTISCRGC